MTESTDSRVAVHIARALWFAIVGVSTVCFVAGFPDYMEYLDTGSSGCELSWDGDVLRLGEPSRRGAPCEVAGLKPETRVVAIDGQLIDREAGSEALRALEWGKSGSEHTWKVAIDGRVLDVAVHYEHGPIASVLTNAGANHAHKLVSGLTLAGAAIRTMVFVFAAAMLIRSGWNAALPIMLSGAFIAYALGLGLSDGHHADWLTPLYELCTLFVLTGLALACVLLPDGTLRGRWGQILSAVWIGVGVIFLAPSYLPWDAVEQPLNLWIQLGFLGVGVMTLAFRYLYQSTLVERTQLQWIVLGLLIGFVALLVRMLGVLSPNLAELHEILIYPLVLCVTPMAITSAVVKYRVWDLPMMLRRATLFGMWLLFASSLILVMAEFVPALLSWFGVVPGEAFPALVEPLMIFMAAMVVSSTLTNVVRLLTDRLFFPGEIRATRAVVEAKEALVDCWSLDEVIWCARHFLAAGFAVKQCAVLMRVGDEWVPLGVDDHWHRPLTREQREALGEGRFMMIKGKGAEPPAALIPLESHGELIGALVAFPRREIGYTSRDVGLMQELAPHLGNALWRNTRDILFAADPELVTPTRLMKNPRKLEFP